MTHPIIDLSEKIAASRAIDASDTEALRQVIWPDGEVGRDEAEVIFALNDAVQDRAPEWSEFFINAICSHMLDREVPRGYINDDYATWLMAKLEADGHVDTLAELDLVVTLLERAMNAPDAFKAYVLDRIEHAVVHGDGPTRVANHGAHLSGEQALAAGSIGELEVSLLRRTLYARASAAPASISRSESELLFRIKDATLKGENAPEWETLFVNALRQHLLEVAGRPALTREEAGRLDAFMNDTSSSIGGFLGRMAGSVASGNVLSGGADRNTVFNDVMNRAEAQPLRADQQVDAEEQAWMDGAVNRDGQIDRYEAALIRALADEDFE